MIWQRIYRQQEDCVGIRVAVKCSTCIPFSHFTLPSFATTAKVLTGPGPAVRDLFLSYHPKNSTQLCASGVLSGIQSLVGYTYCGHSKMCSIQL